MKCQIYGWDIVAVCLYSVPEWLVLNIELISLQSSNTQQPSFFLFFWFGAWTNPNTLLFIRNSSNESTNSRFLDNWTKNTRELAHLPHPMGQVQSWKQWDREEVESDEEQVCSCQLNAINGESRVLHLCEPLILILWITRQETVWVLFALFCTYWHLDSPN